MDKHVRRALILTILFALLILILSILPADMTSAPGGLYFEHMDKFAHGIMYGIFALLVTNLYLSIYSIRFWPLFSLVMVTWFYSIIMELLQLYLISTRAGEIMDAVANLIGILVGTFAYIGYKKIRS